MERKLKPRQVVCSCKNCGVTFSYETISGTRRKYCSEKCRKESFERRLQNRVSRPRKKSLENKKIFICPKCRKKHNDGYKDYKNSLEKPKWKYCYECKRLVSQYNL